MPRNLQPRLSMFTQKPARGSLSTLPDPSNTSGASAGASSAPMSLSFQYNPETVTRTRTGTWESKNQKKGGSTTTQADKNQSANRGAGLFIQSETIGFRLILDATELVLSGEDDQPSKGILPELAVLETFSVGTDQKPPDDQSATSSNGLLAIHAAELLLILGSRAWPVVITAMTITEQRFNPDLTPVRAEIDLKLRVLEDTELAGGSSDAQRAFDKMKADRAANAAEGSSGADPVTAALQTPGTSGSSI